MNKKFSLQCSVHLYENYFMEVKQSLEILLWGKMSTRAFCPPEHIITSAECFGPFCHLGHSVKGEKCLKHGVLGDSTPHLAHFNPHHISHIV